MSNDRDDLLRRAEELESRAEGDGAEPARPVIEEKIRSTGWFRRISSIFASMMKVLGPIGTFTGWIFGLLARWLRWVTLEKDDTGDTSFSTRQTAIRLMISGVAVFSLHVLFSAIYFYTTAFEETVYVTGKQEIETGELYQFGGCTSLPCSTETDNGKFYLIEASLYFPTMLYPEENVFANIPHQNAACQVEGFGIYFRSMRWIYKSLQLYQHVVDVECRPYTEQELEKSVEQGEILTQ